MLGVYLLASPLPGFSAGRPLTGLLLKDSSPQDARSYLLGSPIRAIALAPAGEAAAVLDSEGLLRVFEGGTGIQMASYRLDAEGVFLDFDDSNRCWVAATRSSSYALDCPPSSELTQSSLRKVWSRKTADSWIAAVGVNQTAYWLATENSVLKVPRMPAISSRKDSHRIAKKPLKAGLLSLAFSSAQEALFVAGKSRRMYRLNPKDFALEATFPPGEGWITCLAVTPEGKELLSAGDSSQITVWDVSRRIPLAFLRGHAGWISSMALSPEGRWLAAAGSDSVVRIYDLPKRTLRKTFRGHAEEIRALAFVPGQSILLSGDDAGVLNAWDLRELL